MTLHMTLPFKRIRGPRIWRTALGITCLFYTYAATATSDLVDSATHSQTGQAANGVMMKKPMTAGDDIHDVTACNIDGLALSGVDVVSYHTATGPLIGNEAFTSHYNGLDYRFLSQAHLERFEADPERYLPSYLGWCATSLALGALTCPNPLNYKLEDGRLLLFETTGFTNGQDLWNADPLDYRRRADRNHQRFTTPPSQSSGR